MEFNAELFREELKNKRSGKSHLKFSAMVGLPKDTLYNIEKGGTPNLCTLYKILTVFSWDIKQFETNKNK